MRRVDRASFVKCADANPYDNTAPSLGFNSKMSTPTMHAEVQNFRYLQLIAVYHCAGSQLLEYIHPILQNASSVLDIGCGSGYLTAVMALMLEGKDNGYVYGIDHIEGIIADAAHNFEQVM